MKAILDKHIEGVNVWLHRACFDSLPCLAHRVCISCLHSLHTKDVKHRRRCLCAWPLHGVDSTVHTRLLWQVQSLLIRCLVHVA